LNIAEREQEDGGYGIYAADDTVPVVGDGLTEDEAKASF